MGGVKPHGRQAATWWERRALEKEQGVQSTRKSKLRWCRKRKRRKRRKKKEEKVRTQKVGRPSRTSWYGFGGENSGEEKYIISLKGSLFLLSIYHLRLILRWLCLGDGRFPVQVIPGPAWLYFTTRWLHSFEEQAAASCSEWVFIASLNSLILS